jgi:hypothetical protein
MYFYFIVLELKQGTKKKKNATFNWNLFVKGKLEFLKVNKFESVIVI